MSESVTVGVRIRPLNTRELASKRNHIAWAAQDNQITRVDGPVASTNATRLSHSFRYDSVFEKHCTNEHVYTQLGSPVVEAALGGFNGTIFAYGQTSSGKTHSMLGDQNDPGITPLAIRHVLHTASTSRKRTFLIRAVYVEIYNDKIRDLLNPTSADLTVREDKAGRVFVDAHETLVETFEDAIAVLEKGQAARHVGETKMNARSSRSHTVFTLHIESKSVEGLDASFRASTLNLVDLAGSERLKSTGAAGTRQKEGAHINQSLLVLGTIINRLSSAGADASKIGHLPYRDSKLTRLLRPALGGNARTAVLCAVTPAAAHAEETLSTLKFAERAKKVSTNATRNEVVDYRAKYKEASTEVAVLRERFDIMQKELASLRSSKVRVVDSTDAHEPCGDVSLNAESHQANSPTPDPPVTTSSCTVTSSSSSSVSSMSSRPLDDIAKVEEETSRAIALRSAQDELKFLKAHVDEVESENEHLKARLRVKAGEFTGLRKRAIELRSKARVAEAGERKLRRTLKSGYAKLEDARQQLSISRKKGAHVRIAENVLQELSEQMHRSVNALKNPDADENPSEKQVTLVRPSPVLSSNDNGITAATQLALRYGSSATAFAALYGVNVADGSESSQHIVEGEAQKGGRTPGSTRRRPRPLPEDMVAEIDDSDRESASTSAFGVEDEEWQDFDAMDVVELGESGSSADREPNGSDSAEEETSSPNTKAKKKSKWRSLRSFYGYTDGVYDEMMGGHKIGKDSTSLPAS